jgi:hypothetical protein
MKDRIPKMNWIQLDLELQHTVVWERPGLVLLFKDSVDLLVIIKAELVDLDLAVNQVPLVAHLHPIMINQDQLAVHWARSVVQLQPLEVSPDMEEVRKEELRDTALLLVDMEETLLVNQSNFNELKKKSQSILFNRMLECPINFSIM